MYPGINFFTPFSHLICPRHPRCKSISALGSHQAIDCLSISWESHPRPFFVSRPRITEVSLSPVLSLPTRKQSGLSRISSIARPFGVMAHLRFGLTFRSYRLTCLMNGYSIFKVSIGICFYLSLSLIYWHGKISFEPNFFSFFEKFYFFCCSVSSVEH